MTPLVTRWSSPDPRMTLATVFAAIAILSFGVSTAVADNERLEARQSVEKAKVTIDEFKADPSMTWFRDNLPKAKAVLVVPVLIKGGLILGGSGGHGALLWHDEETDTWSYPAFYFMGAVTFGLQIGGEAAQVVLMVMTEKGRRALLSSEFKLGADVSVAAGPVGAGAQAATTDVLAFSRNKGLFGGLTAEGSIVSPRQEWNDAYYGEPAATTDILIRQSVANSHADPLRQSVALARAAAAPAPVAAEPEEPAPTATPAQTYDLATIQAALNAEGYDAGPADGLMGANTRAAIRSYQAAAGFEVTGNPSLALQRSLAGGN